MLAFGRSPITTSLNIGTWGFELHYCIIAYGLTLARYFSTTVFASFISSALVKTWNNARVPVKVWLKLCFFFRRLTPCAISCG